MILNFLSLFVKYILFIFCIIMAKGCTRCIICLIGDILLAVTGEFICMNLII